MPTVNSFDQTFGAEVLIDLEIGYDVTKNINVAVGANNLLDAYPDRDLRPGQQNNGIIYPQFSPFGFSGGFWYLRANVKF